MNMTCAKCGDEYTLGVNGTVDGCDACEGIQRNRAGQIIYGLMALVLLVLMAGCTRVAATPPKVEKPKAAAVVQVAQTATPQVVTLCGDVNVRPGASEHGAVIRWLKAGATPTVLEWREGWARIGAGEWVTRKAICP